MFSNDCWQQMGSRWSREIQTFYPQMTTISEREVLKAQIEDFINSSSQVSEKTRLTEERKKCSIKFYITELKTLLPLNPQLVILK